MRKRLFVSGSVINPYRVEAAESDEYLRFERLHKHQIRFGLDRRPDWHGRTGIPAPWQHETAAVQHIDTNSSMGVDREPDREDQEHNRCARREHQE